MEKVLAVLLTAVAAAVIILMLVEIWHWRRRGTVISRRQFVLRMVGGAILLALLAAIFVGDYVLGLRSPAGRPVLFLAWWMICLALGMVLLFLAAADMRHVEESSRRREHEIWRDFARLLAERIRRDRGEDGPDAPDARE